MHSDELESLLSSAFDAQARASVPDVAAAPPPRFESLPAVTSLPLGGASSGSAATGAASTGAASTGAAGGGGASSCGAHRAPRSHRTGSASRSRRGRFLAPLSAAAAIVLAVSIGVVALRAGDDHKPVGAAHPGTAAATVSAAKRDVHVRLLNHDGSEYGVGMPVIAFFSQKITDGRAFQRATSATVNGKPITVAWYFEPSQSGYPIEAHLRPQHYWPAKAKIHVSIASKGLSAGDGKRFDDGLTLDFTTGPKQVATVADHELTLQVQGRAPVTYPVSLGAASSPTRSGVKVIMDRPTAAPCIKDRPRMTACATVQYAQRLTYDGEFLLAAPWNTNIGKADTSQGSVDLSKAGAKALYDTLRIGDVVVFDSTGGPKMRLGNGYGDWTVSWSYWLKGGSVPTR